MGINSIGNKQNSFNSKRTEYSTPIAIVNPLIIEFNLV